MTDFSSVNLRILSPDGKTVLAELQTIDKVGQRAAGNATAIGGNMRKSVTAARQLAFAASGVTQGLTGAVGAAGNLAESIAMSSRNAKIAAGAGAIGAIVSTALAVGLAWKKGQEQLQTFLATTQQLASQTKIADLAGRGAASDHLAKREAIIAAGARDADQLRETIKHEWQRNEALKARAALTQAQLRALDREVALERQKAFAADVRGTRASLAQSAIAAGGIGLGPMARERFVGVNQLEAQKQAAIDDLMATAIEKRYTPEQFDKLAGDITADFENQKKILIADLDEMANEVGQSFVSSLAGSISDGIVTAIASGSIGDGFKALSAGLLGGLGQLMVDVGTQSLLAAKLMTAIVAALRAFAPEGAIGPSIALILAGSALKGLGSRAMQSGGIGGGAASGSSGFGGSGTIIYRGLINPINPAPNTAGIQAIQPINLTALIFGSPDDPIMQRHFLTTLDKANARRR